MLKCKRAKYKIIELDIMRQRKRMSENKTKKIIESKSRTRKNNSYLVTSLYATIIFSRIPFLPPKVSTQLNVGFIIKITGSKIPPEMEIAHPTPS